MAAGTLPGSWSEGWGGSRHPAPLPAPLLLVGPSVEPVTLGSVPRGVAGKGNPLWPRRSGQAVLPCQWLLWGRCPQSEGASRSPHGDRSGLPGVGWWHRSCLCPAGGSSVAVGTGERACGWGLRMAPGRVGSLRQGSRLHEQGWREGTGHPKGRGTSVSALQRGLHPHTAGAAQSPPCSAGGWQPLPMGACRGAPLCHWPGRPPHSGRAGPRPGGHRSVLTPSFPLNPRSRPLRRLLFLQPVTCR